MDGMDHLEPTADFGPVDEGVIVETRKPSDPLGNDAQEAALAALTDHPGRTLHHRGHRTDDMAQRERTTTILAWVSTSDVAGAGLFEIAPDGVVTGSFGSTRPPGL